MNKIFRNYFEKIKNVALISRDEIAFVTHQYYVLNLSRLCFDEGQNIFKCFCLFYFAETLSPDSVMVAHQIDTLGLSRHLGSIPSQGVSAFFLENLRIIKIFYLDKLNIEQEFY